MGKLNAAPKLIAWGILKTHWIDAIRSQILRAGRKGCIWMQFTD